VDISEFWQENKRWVLGVAAGAVVYLVGQKVVSSTFGADGLAARANQTANTISRKEFFDNEALNTARSQAKEIAAVGTELRERVGFAPDADFQLDGKGDPDTYFPEMARRVRRKVVLTAQESSIDFADQNLVWQPAVGREEIASRLVELNVLEAAAMRLIDASNEVRAAEPDAFGVVAIEAIRIEKAKAQSGARGRARSDTKSPVKEFTVSFQFRCDVATLQNWLERLRSQRPVLGITADPAFVVQAGDQINDPIRVKGAVTALWIQES
jgi:hypothetical protein